MEENKSKVAKVESKIQAKSDIIDYGSLTDERLYQQQQPQYKQSASLYDYNTMHTYPSGGGSSQKYSELPKLEYLHAYQFADEQGDGLDSQDFEPVEYSKHRLSPQLQQLQQLQVQQPQEHLTELEISKSKQYSYSLRKPEQQQHSQSPFHSAVSNQPQAAQLQQSPQAHHLHQEQSQQQQQQQQQHSFHHHQQQPHQQQHSTVNQYQSPQFSSFGRETAYLKQTPSTVIPHHHHQQEEFKFQRNTRPLVVDKEVSFDEDTKPVHIHHHYPVQHTEEAEQTEQSAVPQTHSQFAPQPTRSQFYPSGSGSNSSPKTPQFSSQFQINSEEEPTPKPYTPPTYHHGHHVSSSPSYTQVRKPAKQWQEPTYEAPTTKAPAPKWENPRHSEPQKTEDNNREHQQVVLPNNIRIEIPEEEIYKHIQNSVHQIIRDLKEKRTKEPARGKPLAGQDQSWSKFLMQEEPKKEKHSRVSFNKSSSAYDTYSPKVVEKNPFAIENPNAAEKLQDQAFQQFHKNQQNQQPQHFNQFPQRINNRQHDEEKPFTSQNKFGSFRYENNFVSQPANSARITEATQYENGFPRETLSTTVDITMKNPKKAPVIDLNALDVGQTWNHDSHFENQDFKNDHTQAYFPSQNRPSASQLGNFHTTGPANFTTNNNLFALPNNNQPQYLDQNRVPSNLRGQNTFQPDNNGNGVAFVGSAISVKDPFARSIAPTQGYFRASQPEPEVPEVDIMHGMLPVVNQYDNGQRVMKVILDPSKMPRELMSEGNPSAYQQQDFINQPGNMQTIQYNMNHQLAIPIVPNQFNQRQQQPQQQQQQQPELQHGNYPDPQQNFVTFPKERKEQHKHKNGMPVWVNNIPEGSANVIQYLPPPPLPASRSLLPYDSYSPIYNEEVAHAGGLGKTIFHSLEPSSTIMRNKRHRGSEEYKKIIRAYPRNGKKVKTVKILEPSTEMRPPPKFNKFSKKSSTWAQSRWFCIPVGISIV